MTAEVSTATDQTAAFQVSRRPTRRRIAGRRNWLGGAFAWLWLMVVMLPIYWIVITSVKTQANYFVINPLVPPTDPTMENYQLVLEFVGYFIKSVIVTVGAVAPAVLVSFMAAFAIVRGFGRFLGSVNSLFLMGLVIPLQATIIPVYLIIIIRLHLYDSLLAIILPSIAFAILLSVLVLSNFIRDVPKELFESMGWTGPASGRRYGTWRSH